jgi:hypothetical protein
LPQKPSIPPSASTQNSAPAYSKALTSLPFVRTDQSRDTLPPSSPATTIHDSIQLDEGYRLDLLVEDSIIIEIKSVESLAPVHHLQLKTYFRTSRRTKGAKFANDSTSSIKARSMRKLTLSGVSGFPSSSSSIEKVSSVRLSGIIASGRIIVWKKFLSSELSLQALSAPLRGCAVVSRARNSELFSPSISSPSPSPSLTHRPIYRDSVFPASVAPEYLPLGRRKPDP